MLSTIILSLHNMDITSLPNEMLTNVLKYTEFNTIRKIRKMNERMNKLAKRADIGIRVPVMLMELSQNSITMLLYPKDNLKRSSADNFYSSLDSQSTSTLALLLSRVEVGAVILGYSEEKVIETHVSENIKKNLPQSGCEFDIALAQIYACKIGPIVIGLRMKKVHLNDTLIEVMKLQKQAFRHLHDISFQSLNYALSKENLTFLLRDIFPRLTTLMIHDWSRAPNIGLSKICNTEVFGDRVWKRLELYTFNSEGLSFDDDFLVKVASKCQDFQWGSSANKFTVRGVISLLKKCQVESKLDHSYRFYKLMLGDANFNEVEQLLRNMLPEASVVVNQKDTLKKYQVKIRLPCTTLELHFDLIDE